MSENNDSSNENLVAQDSSEEHNGFNDNAHDNVSCDNSDDEHSKTKGDRIGIVNVVLAYTHYGISSATPDNVLEVVCAHFTLQEIEDAKRQLWRECDLGEPPLRKSSKGRKVLEAHFRDIMDQMFKLDRQDYIFMVGSGDIARLPRFNAECLNVTAIDRRIADLNEQCFALKLEASAYRNDYMRCQDEISIMKTVLQQHTNALRYMQSIDKKRNDELPPPSVTSGAVLQSQPFLTSGEVQQSQPPVTTESTPKSHPSVTSGAVLQSQPLLTSGEVQQSHSCESALKSHPSVTSGAAQLSQPSVTSASAHYSTSVTSRAAIFDVPASLTSQLSVTSSVVKSPNKSNGSVLTPNSVDVRPATRSAHTSPTVTYSSFLHQPIPDSLSPRHRSPGRSQPKQPRLVQQSSNSSTHPPTITQPNIDSDGFQRNQQDIKKDRRMEFHRKKVVYGTRRSTDNRLSDGNDGVKDPVSDLFVYHVKHDASIADMRGYLCDNGITIADIRIDITSHQSAEFKSFRIIAPNKLRDKLLSAEFWPVNVRVKPRKRSDGPRNDNYRRQRSFI